jgi:hypothetical protein
MQVLDIDAARRSTTKSAMMLETHAGIVAKSAAVADIAPAISGLTGIGLLGRREGYIILNSGDEEYLQAAGTVEGGFDVERRDGCAGEHYAGNRRVSAAELTEMLTGYLTGSTTWSHLISWRRIKLAPQPAND